VQPAEFSGVVVDFTFPKSRRLRKRADFLAVQQGGNSHHSRYFVLVQREGSGRLGITVSKKVGNAVTRNHLKRVVREFVRQHWLPSVLPENRDVVLIARQSAASASTHAIWADLGTCGKRLVH
jgi:ribonuclease P protein component